MGFPCLSFCSFQLDDDALRYGRPLPLPVPDRARGYGNYLGLGQLLGYVCAAVGLNPGQLTIIAGVAAVDSAARCRIAGLAESAKEFSDL